MTGVHSSASMVARGESDASAVSAIEPLDAHRPPCDPIRARAASNASTSVRRL